MSPNVLLGTIAGLLVAAGLVLAVAGWRGAGLRRGPRPERRPRPRLQRRHGVAVAAGILTLLVTGWPVAALAAGGAVVYLPLVWGGKAVAKRAILLTEALATWTRSLASLLGTDGIGTVTEALRYSMLNCPHLIAPQVNAMVARIGPQGVETAMRLFARDVDDTAADKLAMVVILRERNGGGGLAAALGGVAEDLDNRARSLREIEAERAKPRDSARTIVIAFLSMAGLGAVFGHSYLSTYDSPLGELALALVVALFALALRWIRKLADPPRAIRVLSDPLTEPVLERAPS